MWFILKVQCDRGSPPPVADRCRRILIHIWVGGMAAGPGLLVEKLLLSTALEENRIAALSLPMCSRKPNQEVCLSPGTIPPGEAQGFTHPAPSQAFPEEAGTYLRSPLLLALFLVEKSRAVQHKYTRTTSHSWGVTCSLMILCAFGVFPQGMIDDFQAPQARAPQFNRPIATPTSVAPCTVHRAHQRISSPSPSSSTATCHLPRIGRVVNQPTTASDHSIRSPRPQLPALAKPANSDSDVIVARDSAESMNRCTYVLGLLGRPS